jgi:hypothetical protein
MKFSKAEVASWAFVEAELEMHRMDVSLNLPPVKVSVLNQSMLMVVESEILTNERERLISPRSCVRQIWNDIKMEAFFQACLSILRYSRASENS